MRFGVGERQCTAPGTAEYQPALDVQVFAQTLDIGDQVPGRILDEAGTRTAASAAALIEHHDAIVVRVEKLPRAFVGSRAGTAVQENRRLAGGIAAFLIINLVYVRDAQVAVTIGLERRGQFAARCTSRTGAGNFPGLQGASGFGGTDRWPFYGRR